MMLHAAYALKRSVELFMRFRFGVLLAEGHGPQTDSGYLNGAVSQRNKLHGSPLVLLSWQLAFIGL